MIEFKSYVEDFHKREVYKWFEQADFYYDTYMPDKIMEEEIEQLLGYYGSYITLIICDKRVIGLCDFIIEQDTAKIEFRIAKKDELEPYTESKILYDYCKKIFNNYPVKKISKFVYEFDTWGHELFNAKFYHEGDYSRYIYKDYKYWKVSVYSLLREEFFMIEEELR